MEKLRIKYNLSITEMMLIASLDQLTAIELNDLEYIEDRINHHKELLGI